MNELLIHFTILQLLDPDWDEQPDEISNLEAKHIGSDAGVKRPRKTLAEDKRT